MSWIKSENSDARKPDPIIRSGTRVILNRNFKKIEATEERGEHWEYETWDMTAEQYEVYKEMEAQAQEQTDALIELAGIISEMGG